jgi:Tfp pilus assembly PilM family ATPase/Tfp pilus assembly protein PilN
MIKKGARAGSCAGKPRKEVLLIEIGNDWIKLIQAESQRGKVTLSKVHLEPIDANLDISESIRKALKSGRFSQSSALVCLPRQTVNVRLLELPSTDSAEIADMVDLQIGRQTPYSRDEILADYKEIGYTRQGTYTRVMLAIVQRSIVRERFYEIEGAGVEIERMGISCEGVFNWFLHRTKGDTTTKAKILTDVDSFYTHLLVVHHGKIIFTKSILVGGLQLLESGAESTERLVREVSSAIQSCRDESRDIEFESVMVSGAGVHIDGLSDAMGRALSLPCDTVDCLADVKLGKGAGDLGDSRYAGASLTGLIGVALDPDMMEFDLVPDVVKARKQLMYSALSTNTFAALVMVAMVSFSLYAMLSYSFKANRLKKLNAVIEEMQPEVVKVQRMIEVIREANRRQDPRFSMMNLFPEVHRCVPKDMYFETMDIDAEKREISVMGTASTFQDIQKLNKMLEDSPLFKGAAEEGSAVRDNKGRYKFKVVAQFEERK